MEEPRVIIYQTASEKERQSAAASSAGIDENNPTPTPGGEIGGIVWQDFRVRNSGSIGYSDFLTDDDRDLQVQQF